MTPFTILKQVRRNGIIVRLSKTLKERPDAAAFTVIIVSRALPI